MITKSNAVIVCDDLPDTEEDSTAVCMDMVMKFDLYNLLFSVLGATIDFMYLSKSVFSGFKSNHSTSHAINYSGPHINDAIKSKKHTLGIFIDLSKAFDTIDHSKLLHKLDNYGIRGMAYQLIVCELFIPEIPTF